MRKTILLTAAGLLLAGAARTLAQTTDPQLENGDSPFVRLIRPDRPGQTITTNMLYPGQFQIETGLNSYDRSSSVGYAGRTAWGNTLRVGFFNHIELRATQNYLRTPDVRPLTPEGTPAPYAGPAGFAPLNVGAKFLASTVQNAPSQVVLLLDMNLRNGNASFGEKQYEPGARLLVSQQLGQRFGLEGNFGFRQRGFKAEGTKQGQYLTTLALNGPLDAANHFGFFTETYATWQRQQGWLPGLTSGVYWRPLPGLRFDVNAGHGLTGAAGGFNVGGGLSMRLGK
ncbi:Putative MetA-pathway of phenol degradation [Hymenobacter gelipurpurascens]|uniref:Putative MetA-pathway of phenol degradation n=1 Tax=Hymenobacter gelipurpurascens TaxID=89968 RepID=A0A212TID9_9BACT|nr:transporter [Hymenobacter gelipurpurascens]SNC65817.1 Putative MetA-pathway of phenol degradation [Hymenobacter gelipurpurascens]